MSSSAKLLTQSSSACSGGFQDTVGFRTAFCCEQAFHWPSWSFEGSASPNSGLHFTASAIFWKHTLKKGGRNSRESSSVCLYFPFSKKSLSTLRRNSAGDGRHSSQRGKTLSLLLGNNLAQQKWLLIDWIPSPVPAWLCHCKLCLCHLWQPMLQVGDSRQVFLCQDPLQWRDVWAGKNANSLCHSFTCVAAVVALKVWIWSVPCCVKYRPQTWRVCREICTLNGL